MIGLKDFCALLLAGGMGASGVVAVQKARPATVKQAAAKPKVAKAVHQASQARSAVKCPPVLPDVPLPSAAPSIGPVFVPQLASAADQFVALAAAQAPVQGGFPGLVLNPAPGPGVPAIPAPPTWIHLVAGFGCLGLAARRGRKDISPCSN